MLNNGIELYGLINLENWKAAEEMSNIGLLLL